MGPWFRTRDGIHGPVDWPASFDEHARIVLLISAALPLAVIGVGSLAGWALSKWCF